MRAAIVEDGVVINVIEVESLEALPGLIAGDGANVGDQWDGSVFSRPTAPTLEPTPRQLTVDDYRVAIQRMLDDKVRERRFYDILNAVSYANSTNPAFKAEALACIAWRDAVWAKAYEALDLAQSGAALQPTIAGLLAMMPALTWPEA